MDAIQILLIIMLIVSTFFLSIIGIQLFITLNEFRRTLRNVNKVVQGFEDLGIGVGQGLNEVMGFMNGFKVILKALNIIHSNRNESSKK